MARERTTNRRMDLQDGLAVRSFQEIADDLPGIKDAKAAENLVFRERRRLQKK